MDGKTNDAGAKTIVTDEISIVAGAKTEVAGAISNVADGRTIVAGRKTADADAIMLVICGLLNGEAGGVAGIQWQTGKVGSVIPDSNS